jgi:hypothetical protein
MKHIGERERNALGANQRFEVSFEVIQTIKTLHLESACIFFS